MNNLIPGWNKMPRVVRMRYGQWKALSSARREDAVRVTVRTRYRTTEHVLEYLFESMLHARLCIEWWEGNGYHPEIMEI